MQTDSTQLAPPPSPQKIEKTQSQQELDMYMMQHNPELMREMQDYRLRERSRDFEGNSLVPIFEMFIPLTFFIMTGIVLIKFFQNRHQERMQIIERGLDPVAYKELYSMPKFKFRTDRLGVLKWALLAVFVGLGIFVGEGIAALSGKGRVDSEIYYPASMLICGGIGLIIFYMIASKYDRQEKLNNAENNA
ncbi:MAG: DUF6249 domain-containing protein [Bacteroidota bacterium]